MSEVTPKPGETGTPKAPENNTPTSAPTQGNADDTAIEQLRKENLKLKEQFELRERQIANEKKTREDAEAAKQAKKLEEQNEFKTLHEQEKAKREALETQIENETKRKELDKAKAEAMTDYSDEVKALAEETGLALDSTDEATVAAFKEKLDKIQKMVGIGKVGPSNPGRPTGSPELSGDELKLALKDDAKFQEIVSQRKGISIMMTPKR